MIILACFLTLCPWVAMTDEMHKEAFGDIRKMPKQLIVNSLTVVFQQHTFPTVILISLCALDWETWECCSLFFFAFCQWTRQLNLCWIHESLHIFLPLAQPWCHSNHSNHWGELRRVTILPTPPVPDEVKRTGPWRFVFLSHWTSKLFSDLYTYTCAARHLCMHLCTHKISFTREIGT